MICHCEESRLYVGTTKQSLKKGLLSPMAAGLAMTRGVMNLYYRIVCATFNAAFLTISCKLPPLAANSIISLNALSMACGFAPRYQLLAVKSCSAKVFKLSLFTWSSIKVRNAVGFRVLSKYFFASVFLVKNWIKSQASLIFLLLADTVCVQ